jgi:hypothetical protein
MATVGRGRSLLKALVPPAAAIGYLCWRRGGTLPTSVTFWAIFAVLIVPAIAASLLGDRLRRSGRDMTAGLVVFASIAWLFGGSALLAMKTEAVTLIPAERADFVVVEEGGQRRLRHPTLGFSFLHPGAGFVAGGSQAFSPSCQFYAFTDPAAGMGVTLGMFKGEGGSPASLRKLLESMGQQADALGGPAHLPARVVELEMSPADLPRGTMHVVLSDGRHYRSTAYGWRSPGGTPFAILIAVMARSPDAGGDVLASFHP